MDRNTFIKRVTDQLTEIKVPYLIANNTDVSITTTFNKQKEEEDDDTGVILYTALLFLNFEKNTVFAYEKAILNQRDISKDSNYGQIKVKNEDMDDSGILVASILGFVASVATSMGLLFEKTDDVSTASYPEGYIPIMAGIPNTHHVAETPKTNKFCINCGAKMEPGKRFCPACGADSQKSPIPQVIPVIPFVSKDTPPVFVNKQQPYVDPNTQGSKPKKKTPVWIIILIVILIIGILVVGGIFLVRGFFTIKPPSTSPVVTNGEPSGSTGSSVVSLGVQKTDLGNIMNGQYYFATDDYIFYSSFDIYDSAHIYRTNKDGTDLIPIFDGFGWSLVVIDNWLYFSGNQGAQIDGTYNIFRMRLDGSQVENINSNYCYGMFLYDTYLYYMKRSTDYMDKFSICRSSLDGSNETVIYPNGMNPVIYDNLLYYNDNLGNIFRSNPDGTEPQVLVSSVVNTYVLGNEKIIYIDFDFNINSCNLDGTNNKLIRNAQERLVQNINAYNDRIFFTEYKVDDYNYETSSFNYIVKSMGFDGSNEKQVFSSSSYGMYPNLVNNKLMLMDYVRNPDSGLMKATVKIMDLDGSNQSILDR